MDAYKKRIIELEELNNLLSEIITLQRQGNFQEARMLSLAYWERIRFLQGDSNFREGMNKAA